jgi:hypothetical protein
MSTNPTLMFNKFDDFYVSIYSKDRSNIILHTDDYQHLYNLSLSVVTVQSVVCETRGSRKAAAAAKLIKSLRRTQCAYDRERRQLIK